MRDLIAYQNPQELQRLWDDLDYFGRQDAERPHLARRDIAAVLQRYLAGELTAQQVEDWADYFDAIGGYEDEAMGDIVYILGNPALEGPLTAERAKEFMAVLNGA